MLNWYEVTARYVSTEDGAEKKVSEKYLVSGICVSDAERVVQEQIAQYVSTDIDIRSAVQKPIDSIFRSGVAGASTWYRCKVMFDAVDEKSGRVVRTPLVNMVLADGFDDAVEVLKKGMSGILADWEVHTVSETAIVDVYGQ